MGALGNLALAVMLLALHVAYFARDRAAWARHVVDGIRSLTARNSDEIVLFTIVFVDAIVAIVIVMWLVENRMR